MVGGFSFYDRSEIKDLLSYLKLVQNPDDSIALARIINTPPRGIGKTTLEVLERLSLETGMSTWGAIGRALQERLLPQRALMALRHIPPFDTRCPRPARARLCRKAGARRSPRAGVHRA